MQLYDTFGSKAQADKVAAQVGGTVVKQLVWNAAFYQVFVKAGK